MVGIGRKSVGTECIRRRMTFFPGSETLRIFEETLIIFLFDVRRIIILNTTSLELFPGSLSFSGSGERLLFLGRISSLTLAPGTLSNLDIRRTCNPYLILFFSRLKCYVFI